MSNNTIPLTSIDSSNNDYELVESLSLALVREYLAKRKFTTTLNSLYSELGYKPQPTTTAKIAEGIGLTKLLTKNKKSSKPYDTLLEILSDYIRNRQANKTTNNEQIEGDTTGNNKPESNIAKLIPVPSSSSTNGNIVKSNNDVDIKPLISSNPLTAISSKVQPISSLNNPISAYNPIKTTTSSSNSLNTNLADNNIISGSTTNSNNGNNQMNSRQKPSANAEMLIEDVEDLDFPSSSSSGQEFKSTNTFSNSNTTNNSIDFRSNNNISSSNSNPVISMGVAITPEDALKLKEIIFGANNLNTTFTNAWLEQGFYFKSSDILSKAPNLSFGLVQAQGGPCGILAAVQAYILKELLYNNNNSNSGLITDSNRLKLLSSSPDTMKSILINALSEILWLAGGSHSAKICVKNNNKMLGPKKIGTKLYKPDGLFECINIIEFNSFSSVKQFIIQNLAVYQATKGLGVVLFLFSLCFSHGLDNILSDFDINNNSCLIGSHSYCTQEMVNLTITGKALSNVFNGNKDMDGLIFKGIEKQSDIGLLSLFEHYQNIEVGTYLKQSRYPIWIICSESHYTVLFSLQKNRAADDNKISKQGQIFDLYYYDELVQQNEEIRLTIDTTHSEDANRDKDLEPPINDCIRTKWGKHARIDWNGTEPIL